MTNDNVELDALDKLAGGSAVLSRRKTAQAFHRAPETIEDWIAKGLFPPWIQLTPGGPKEQLVSVVRAHLAKRRRARYKARSPRGALMRGRKLERQGGE